MSNTFYLVLFANKYYCVNGLTIVGIDICANRHDGG